MANGISGSGGVDSSSLDELLIKLNNILDTQGEINNARVKPKGDDSEIRKINDQLSHLRENIENSNRTNLELFNTKAVQRDVKESKDILDSFLDKFKDDISDMTPEVQKEFITNFKILEKFGERFGQNLISEYQKTFDKITHITTSSNNFYEKKSLEGQRKRINEYLESAKKEANQRLNGTMFDAVPQANETVFKEQRQLLLKQKEVAKESAEAFKQAEIEKQDALKNTRDAIVENLTRQLEEIKSSSGSGEFLEIDYDQWGKFQKSAGDMIQTLAEMGVEVKDLENLLDSISKKVYLPKDQVETIKHRSGDGLSDEISKGFNSEELSSFLNILEKIEEQLRNISSTLGTVDENSGFNNMISSIDVLLSKLDEMHKKIETGIYNINVNQGSDETTFAQDESVKSYIRDTQNRYKSAYDKVVKKAGGEELLFTRINNILNTGIDQLNEAYSSINVSKIESKEQQVYRLMDFFKILRQAMSDENFGLDLKGVRLPSSNDENFRRSIRNKSGETERRKQQRARESLLSDEPEETLPGLNQITQALERIEILITEISQKDLFGDSLSKVSEQLDEIATKFDSIVSDVRVINEDPIAISNQTPVSSGAEEVNEEAKAFENLAESMDKVDRERADDSVQSDSDEIATISRLNDMLIEVTRSIDVKTRAFQEEGQVVDGVVQNEINNLDALSGTIISIKDDIEKIAEAFKEVNIDFNIDGDTTSIVKFLNSLSKVKDGDITQKLTNLYTVLDDFIKGVNELKVNHDILEPINELVSHSDELKNLANILSKTKEQIKEASSAVNTKNTNQSSGDDVQAYLNNLRELTKAQKELISAEQSGNQSIAENARQRIARYDEELEKIEKSNATLAKNQKIIEANAKTSKELEKARAEAVDKRAKAEKQAAAQEQRNTNRQSKMLANFNKLLDQNGNLRLKYSNSVNEIINDLQNNVNLTKSELDAVQNKINDLIGKASNAGDMGKSLFQSLQDRSKSLLVYLGSFVSFYKVVDIFKQAFNTVHDLDDVLTEMRKVSEESLDSLRKYQDLTFDVADEIGSTALSLQNATANWMRLGEDLTTAAESAKTATVLMNVSEFENIEDATKALVSASQAYSELDKMDIVDSINKIGNEYSVSTMELSQGLQDAAAVLKTQGNDLNEAIALLTAGNAVTQDISKTAGMKTAWYIWKHIYKNIFNCKVSLKLYATI